MLNKKELQELNNQLPKNKVVEIQKILKKSGITKSRNSVYRVLNGESSDLNILKAATKLAKRTTKELEEIKKTINHDT